MPRFLRTRFVATPTAVRGSCFEQARSTNLLAGHEDRTLVMVMVNGIGAQASELTTNSPFIAPSLDRFCVSNAAKLGGPGDHQS